MYNLTSKQNLSIKLGERNEKIPQICWKSSEAKPTHERKTYIGFCNQLHKNEGYKESKVLIPCVKVVYVQHVGPIQLFMHGFNETSHFGLPYIVDLGMQPISSA